MSSVTRDLKNIYNAATLTEAETALEEFASVWDEKYPTISKSWRAKWPDIITLFDFPWPIRKAISTTNAIENLNGTFRSISRNVKRWRGGKMILRWVATAADEASYGNKAFFLNGEVQINDDWSTYFSTNVTNASSFGREQAAAAREGVLAAA